MEKKIQQQQQRQKTEFNDYVCGDGWIPAFRLISLEIINIDDKVYQI